MYIIACIEGINNTGLSKMSINRHLSYPQNTFWSAVWMSKSNCGFVHGLYGANFNRPAADID